MRVYGIAPWDMDRLTGTEAEALARDLKAISKAAKN